MLLVNEDGSIMLTRGDTAWLGVTIDHVINQETKESYEVKETDTLELSIKKRYKDDVPLVYKKITGPNAFHIEPKDTEGLKFGRYWYDVQLTTEYGDVITIIEPTTFEITKEVTH